MDLGDSPIQNIAITLIYNRAIFQKTFVQIDFTYIFLSVFLFKKILKYFLYNFNILILKNI
jgi:hypothetical protein